MRATVKSVSPDVNLGAIWGVSKALLLGAGAFGVVAALFAGGIAGARGPMSGVLGDGGSFSFTPFTPPPAASVNVSPAPNFVSGPKKTRHKSVAATPIPSNSVCVRLCDGFFFPNINLTGGDAACIAQCPDAPTALYLRPAGSDDIGAAISLRGASYSALPVANREQTTYDETCTCHRAGKHSYSSELMHDNTLRPGDLVMTDKGIRVFEGDKSGGVAPKDFVSLAHASNVAKDWRAELTAMDRAGAWNRQNGPYSSYNADKDASSKRHKGTVIVEDEPAEASGQ
jgi:Protein of unknown function (DUF2865)